MPGDSICILGIWASPMGRLGGLKLSVYEIWNIIALFVEDHT